MERLKNTPIQTYGEILVKREDLAGPDDSPPFSKIRGITLYLEKALRQGIAFVGYMETSISYAGWALSYFTKDIDITPVIYYPQYKSGLINEQEKQLSMWKKYNAIIVPIEKPNRLRVNYYIARKLFREKYSANGEMIEQGMPFHETINEVSKQVKIHDEIRDIKTIVCSSGSGTMIAGILKGLSAINSNADVYGVLVSPKNCVRQKNMIIRKSGLKQNGLVNRLTANLTVVDCGYKYDEKESIKCPFPCNPYYDRKAWKFLIDNYRNMKKPILFWNIGA